MGVALTRTLSRVLPEFGPGSTWQKNARGPTLRRLFGAYDHPDLWGLYRRWKTVDPECNGYFSYDELQNLVVLPEPNLMFIWDLFSQQNELIPGRELMTMICVFSSAGLKEKGRFLLTLYDTSRSSMLTAQDVASLCVGVLAVVAKCTGVVVKPKEVTSSLRDELPCLLPAYAEAVQKCGAHRAAAEQCFQKERCISPAYFDALLPSIETLYRDLPFAGEPPSDSLPPPPPDWGENPLIASASETIKQQLAASALEKTPTDTPRADEMPYPSRAAGGGSSAARALAASKSVADGPSSLPLMTEPEYTTHFTEQQRRSENAAEAAEAARAALAAKAEVKAQAKAALPPANGTMVIHGAKLADVEKDLPRFQYLFCRGLSAALGIPSSCVEILSIRPGSVCVDFRLHAACRGDDRRNGADLMLLVEEQMANSNSLLRRGEFHDYIASAEFLREGCEKELTKPHHHCCHQPVRLDASTQATDLAAAHEELMRLLDAEKRRYEVAEAELAQLRKSSKESAEAKKSDAA